MTAFIDHLDTQLVTITLSLISTLYKLLTAHPKSFPACSVLTRRFLVTASNNGYFSASVLKSSLNSGFQLPILQVKVRTDGQSASLSQWQAPI
jgi:hypothetical protein